jgi:hypothetical protein
VLAQLPGSHSIGQGEEVKGEGRGQGGKTVAWVADQAAAELPTSPDLFGARSLPADGFGATSRDDANVACHAAHWE